MREILFRGKRVDNGEWVEGSYLATFSNTLPPQIRYYLQTEEGEPVLITVDILPETVGQYTGLPDKNGKKIFEGDIVKFDDVLYHIVFVTGCFRICKNNQISYTLHNLHSSLEIIGNIHDNPELLKEREG